MKFIKILEECAIKLDDGSCVDASTNLLLTENEYNEDFLKKFTDSEKNDNIIVKSIKVIEMTPEEVSQELTEGSIPSIIRNIYIDSLGTSELSVREYANLYKDPVHQALALKQFVDKYHIYKKLTKDLDLTKVTVADFFDKIEKIYAVRWNDDFETICKEIIKQ